MVEQLIYNKLQSIQILPIVFFKIIKSNRVVELFFFSNQPMKTHLTALLSAIWQNIMVELLILFNQHIKSLRIAIFIITSPRKEVELYMLLINLFTLTLESAILAIILQDIVVEGFF
jgi:ABC-type enterobactin transport system permease subunit